MNAKRFYMVRLAAGLLMAAFALACSAILDTDELGSSTSDAKINDGVVDFDGEVPDQRVHFDMGECVPDKTCTIGGLLGRCNFGKTKCLEGGTGICEADFEPTTEECDGANNWNDRDCDGNRDHEDNQAHASCGSGKYCARVGDTNDVECREGCWKDSQCAGDKTDNCAGHVCRCGEGDACTGSATCQGGQCVGPPPPDAGPDQTVDQAVPVPDSTVDQGVPVPDSTVDQAVPVPDSTVDQGVPLPDSTVDQAAPLPDSTVDQAVVDQAVADQTI